MLVNFAAWSLLIASPSFSAEKRAFFYNIDVGYVNNERTQGAIASDRNLEGAVRVINKISEDAQFEFRERFSSLQALGSQTSNHDVGIVYFTKLSAGKLNTEIGLRPFTDTTNTANTNTEGRLAVSYAQALDQNSGYTLKSSYKSQSWTNKSAQDYQTAQLALNYQNRLDGAADLSTSLGYALQGANTATSAFANLTAGVSYQRSTGKNRKVAVNYSFDNRDYPSNAASSAAKNDLVLNISSGAVDFGLGLTQYAVPASAASGYQGFNLSQGFSRALSDFAKWKIKTGLLFRTSSGAANSFAKINLQAGYEQVLAEKQNLTCSNLLENTSYRDNAANFLHNLLGIKYELRFSDNSALALGERFTLDDYPFAASKNATRHQIDLTYQWPVWPGLPLVLSGGYEIKSFSSPSATQSDYRVTSLAASFDYPFSSEGRASFALSRFAKQNAQNAAADTQDGNVTLRVAYNF